VGDEGEQEVPICFGVGERFADRGRDGALRRDPAGGEGAGQGARGGRAARGSGGGREEDAAAAAILEEAQPREPVDDGGSGGGVAAAPGGLGQCREKDVCDARGGPGGIAALCEREEARDGLGDDVLRRKREEGVELEFSPPCHRPCRSRLDRSSLFSLTSPSCTISPRSRGSSTHRRRHRESEMPRKKKPTLEKPTGRSRHRRQRQRPGDEAADATPGRGPLPPGAAPAPNARQEEPSGLVPLGRGGGASAERRDAWL